MSTLTSVALLDEYGRTRLSKNFFMREMLYSEVSNIHGIPNIPDDPELALAAGRRLCEEFLEPLHERFGRVVVRSAYRSARLNGYCHERMLAGDAACWCTDNDMNAARHIWDRRDADGMLGATATVVIPAYLDHYDRTGDFRPLAWWIRDHLPGHADIYFFKRLCAFNIRWYEGSSEQAIWRLDPPLRELLVSHGHHDFDGDHSALYAGII